MSENKMPHPMHEKHLCFLTNLEFQNTNTDDYKQLVKNAKFICAKCGRAAAEEINLCEPVKL